MNFSYEAVRETGCTDSRGPSGEISEPPVLTAARNGTENDTG